ncbi:Nucleoside diphosphate-linked moiety X motif 8 [Araneus ventricosus]|uniref:Nucleoside diphosphate-linked moiety X motif 8 n=1 Tax=Araneus ventricosus TaxID=182803 RepID=A0A4Y2HP22_ARAVE|nr:Nucleoside diphosphate-linked moiety X motif 8 [Araneus ventricosus]
MAKFIAQAMVLGAQVISRAFARALRQEYAATQTAAEKGGGNSRAQVETNLKSGITLQEAKNILNIGDLDPELIKKNFDHLFSVNDKSRGGSLYIQSKGILSSWSTRAYGHTLHKQRFFSVFASKDVFSGTSKEQFIKCMEKLKIDFVTNKTAREASVLIPLCRINGKPSVLLTMRSVTMGRNKGDASFPGGMKELSDKNSIEVALRETQEEIGLSSDVEIWTTMPTFPSRTGNITITPVVAFIGDTHVEDCIVNKDEVEYVFAVSLESLCDKNNIFYTRYKRGYAMPVYIVGEYRIWGLTAMILHYLLKCLLPDDYKNTLQIGVFPRLKISR